MAIRKRATAMTVAEQNRFKNVVTQLITYFIDILLYCVGNPRKDCCFDGLT